MWKSSVSPQVDHPKWTVPKGLNNAVPDVPRHARCQVRDRDTRIGIALQGAQAGRLWRLLGERLMDEEKTAP